MLFSSHGGRMDPSKLFRNGGVVACVVGGSASDSDASQPAMVKLRPKLDGTSSLKPKVCCLKALLSAYRNCRRAHDEHASCPDGCAILEGFLGRGPCM